MSAPRILIAGIGNIFFGDDAFGSEVARRLAARSQPENVRVVDFGIRGLDLTYALLDGYDAAILVDATPRGGAPGTLYVIEPDLNELAAAENAEVLLEPHGMDPVKVLRLASAMGGPLGRVWVLGCEPAVLGTEEDPVMGLSPPVEASVAEALSLIESLIIQLQADQEDAAARPLPVDQPLDARADQPLDAKPGSPIGAGFVPP